MKLPQNLDKYLLVGALIFAIFALVLGVVMRVNGSDLAPFGFPEKNSDFIPLQS